MDSYAYFPSMVYREEKPELVAQALPVCLQALDSIRQPDWTMIQSGCLRYVPELNVVRDYILASANHILKEQGYNLDDYELYVSGLWAQELVNGAGTDVHVHGNSQIAGFLFLETPESGAFPVYHDSRKGKELVDLMFTQGNEINSATNAIYFNNVIPGTVLFNNSWLRHQLQGGPSQLPTRCIHFIVSHKERVCNTN